MIAIIDYGMGNLRSVENALRRLGAAFELTADPRRLQQADRVLLPGVGHAGEAMARLQRAGLTGIIPNLRRPVLGICVGLQVLCRHSEEGDCGCLGVFDTFVRRFAETPEAKVPHMGWNSLRMVRPSRLLEGVAPDAEFYFVHSYFVEPAPELVIATTTYGREFCSIYGRDGLWAVQCHLEKSGRPGLRVLRNFYDYCRSARPEDVTC